MDKMEEHKMEWDKMMASMNRIQELMKDMSEEEKEKMKGMEEEWNKMMTSANKLQEMM